VHEVATRDRAELASREESRDRDIAEGAPYRVHVMVRLTEKSLTAPVARKEESAGNRIGALRLEHRAQILAR
jgi:hypothetical protein